MKKILFIITIGAMLSSPAFAQQNANKQESGGARIRA